MKGPWFNTAEISEEAREAARIIDDVIERYLAEHGAVRREVEDGTPLIFSIAKLVQQHINIAVYRATKQQIN